MADGDLDDFFAKKDKGKKKTKSLKPEDILAQQKKSKKKKKQNAPAATDSAATAKKSNEEDAEWEEVVEQEVDYSGLRIQKLQVSKEDENADDDGGEEGENGDGSERTDGASGPWQKIQSEGSEYVAPRVPTPTNAQTSETTSTPATKPISTGKYVPPARRGAGATSSDSHVVVVSSAAKRKPKVAPNLQSESDFPTLGGSSESAGALRFEEVHRGGRQMEDPSKKHVDLQLDNKFGALQDD